MQGFIAQLGNGHLSLGTAVVWLAAALVLGMAGGAIAGMRLAGKDLGNELAALMGALFGPTAVVPAVLVGLVVLAFV